MEYSVSVTRSSEIVRNTNETQIQIRLNLDEPLSGPLKTGHGFQEHMLDQVRKHGRFGLVIEATGDLHVDVHHLAEDVGIALGQAFKQALGDMKGIERYADAFVPMDETLAHVVLDFSGRAYLGFEPERLDVIGDSNGYNIFHLREFLRGFCNHAGVTLHVRLLSGRESHHVIEAITKAFSRALYLATRITSQSLPSTKGML
ncbi:imidazoleglycerol-phosphate dehydratase HisB [Deinococcus cellulosilyticus]|uniref:Imidazoleglycerol-phosphate dehydratase n=1 Tax=Deinococcus cellulosilyticus (strain DSM 18568 / NBRC 106333 / KACC 11606 / 5516J-15) TaxID=1223518 RepID=A0A511N8W1_DEIC1|nr:imidazoleglycerol-phosphate dehydratase [Deinococcus cellulosilyticus NBRC 106333 = KACC 11606]